MNLSALSDVWAMLSLLLALTTVLVLDTRRLLYWLFPLICDIGAFRNLFTSDLLTPEDEANSFYQKYLIAGTSLLRRCYSALHVRIKLCGIY